MLFAEIEELCKQLRANDRIVTIETAGTVFRDVECDLMSISPKLAGSTPDADSGWAERHERTRIDEGVLRHLIGRHHYQLKFVIDPEGPNDLPEAEALVRRLGVAPENVWLMPEGIDSATLNRRGAMLAPMAIERGWNLTPRLHIELFGNRRGT